MRSELHFSKLPSSFKIPFTTTPEIRSCFFHIQTCGIIHTKEDYYLKRDTLDGMLLLVLLKGKGRFVLDNREYLLEESSGFLIDCRNYHELYSDPHDPMVFCFLHFNGLQSRDYVSSIVQKSGPLFKTGRNERILKNMRRIILSLKKREAGSPIICSGLIHEILTDLMLKARLDIGNSPENPEFVQRVLMYIEEHYFEDLSLDDLAEEGAVSKYHFTRLFRKHCGQSAYDYLLSFRLNKAKEMLLNTAEPVGSIAERSGFRSLSHFSRSFRSREGLSPIEYRRIYRSSDHE